LNRRNFLTIAGAGAVAAKLSVRDDAAARHVKTIWRCGVEAEVRGDRVAALRCLAGHPLNDGRLCPRGLGRRGALYVPVRLLHQEWGITHATLEAEVNGCGREELLGEWK